MSFNITPVASGYQEIHPYGAMNIDSVKINTSLIMMKECELSHCDCKTDLIVMIQMMTAKYIFVFIGILEIAVRLRR